jgi:hypothetical protein
MNIRDSHLTKAGPCWRSFFKGEPRIPRRRFGAQVLLQHCLERTLPTLAKRRNPQRALQLLARLSGQIQESVYVGDTHSLWTVGNFYNVIASPDFSLLQHAKVESWSVMFYEQRWHPRFIHPNADAVARHAWLRYFEDRAADAVSIADADLVIKKSFNGKVFTELTVDEVIASEKAFPVLIGVHLINENGTLFTTVTGQIGLCVSIYIEPARHSPARGRSFPDCGLNSFASPRHVAGKADIY